MAALVVLMAWSHPPIPDWLRNAIHLLLAIGLVWNLFQVWRGRGAAKSA